MIGLWTVLTITTSLFAHTVSIPGLIYRDLLPLTRTNNQDFTEDAQPAYLLPVSTGLHKRRLLWLWGNDDKDESDITTSTQTPYADAKTTTERPSRWSRWMGKVGGAFKKVGSGMKDAANATKWKMKSAGSKIKSAFKSGAEKVGDVFEDVGDGIKHAANVTKQKMKSAGRKVKSAFKSGYKKIKMKFRSADDKLNHFVHRLKIQVENGNEKALRLLQKLGINVHVENETLIGVDVEDEIDSVSNILKEEGILKEKSTTNLEIVTNYITQSNPVRDDIDNEILTTPTAINTPVDNMRYIDLTSLSNFLTSVNTESSRTFTELMRLKFTSEETKPSTASTSKIYADNIISSTPKITEKITKPINVHSTEMRIELSTVSTDKEISTKASNVITEKSTPKHLENLSVTEKISPLVYTTRSVTLANKSTPKHSENLSVTDKISTTQSVTLRNKISTNEPPKITTKIVEVEPPFKTDSPFSLEDAYYDDDIPGEDTSMEEEEEEEVYTPPPFPDVFHDSRVKSRLQELYEKGDFSHEELSDLYDPDYYEYYYDYSD